MQNAVPLKSKNILELLNNETQRFQVYTEKQFDQIEQIKSPSERHGGARCKDDAKIS